MKKQGERQTDLGYTPAEQLPGSSFEIYGDREYHEAAAFTSTQRHRPAGFMDYDPQRNTIGTVYVSPQFRGKGIADRMYEAAGRPAHSSTLTAQGEKFARRVGGQQPEEIRRLEPLDEEMHQEMFLPDTAETIAGSRTARRYQ